MSVSNLMQGNKTKQHLLNVFLQESVMNEAHELAELAIENGANLHKENGDALIKEALLSNNEAMVSLLIKHETLITPESAEKAIGFYRCGDISKKSALNIIKYVDWDYEDEDISIVSLILAVYFKPIPEIKAEVTRHFDFKNYIVSKNLYIGAIFEYIHSHSNFEDVVGLLDSLPVERFCFTHDEKWEIKIKKSLLRAGQFVVLDYLNKRGAFSTGLKFDINYQKEASQISDMLDAGYDVDCKWDINVFFAKKNQAANLFNPLPEKVAKLKAQLRFLLPISEVDDKEDCLQRVTELVYIHAEREHIVSESSKEVVDFYNSLIVKGYLEGIELDLSGIGTCSGDNDDVAYFMRLLQSNDFCWQYILSEKVKVNFDADSLNELSNDFKAATGWLSQYSSDDDVFRSIERQLVNNPSHNPLCLLDILVWNIERSQNPDRERVDSFNRLLDHFSSRDMLWTYVRKSFSSSDMNGLSFLFVYLSDSMEMVENLSSVAKEKDWRLICRICRKGPLDFIKLLSDDSDAKGILASIIAE